MNPLSVEVPPAVADEENIGPVETSRGKVGFVQAAGHYLHRAESFGALDKQGTAPWSVAAIARTAAVYCACWAVCAAAAVACAARWGDARQRTTTIRCCLIELAHGLNACVVKETRHWFFSELDSDVWHTLLFLNCAWYLREPEWWAVLLFAVFRVGAEHAPTCAGGLSEVKARRRASLRRLDAAQPEPPSLAFKCLRLATGYAVWYVLSMAILLRERAGDVTFLLTLVWAFPMTLVVASHYLFTKELWSFLVAHMANLITANPALIAVALGLDSGPHPIWNI